MEKIAETTIYGLGLDGVKHRENGKMETTIMG